MTGLLPLPASRDEILKIQSDRKRVAFECAKQAVWYKGKLDHKTFMEQFCIAPRAARRYRRILAVGWHDRCAGFLSADVQGCRIRHGDLGSVFPRDGYQPGRFLPYLVSHRYSSRRPDLGAVCA